MATVLKTLQEANRLHSYLGNNVQVITQPSRREFDEFIEDLFSARGPFVQRISMGSSGGEVRFTVNKDLRTYEMPGKRGILNFLHNFLLNDAGNTVDLLATKGVCNAAVINYINSSVKTDNKISWKAYDSSYIFNQMEYLLGLCAMADRTSAPELFRSVFKVTTIPKQETRPSQLKYKSVPDYEKFSDIDIDVLCTPAQEKELQKVLDDNRVLDDAKSVRSLLNLLATLEYLPMIAIDTEHNSANSFYGLLALIQLGIQFRGVAHCFLIDPMVDEVIQELYLLQIIVDRPDTIVLIHADSSDASWLYGYFRISLTTFILDTARLAHMLGNAKCGLKNLCAKYLNIEIDKAEQRRDWAKRPLSESQLIYARNDVILLFALITELSLELDKTLGLSAGQYIQAYAFSHMQTCLRPIKAPKFHSIERYSSEIDNTLCQMIQRWVCAVARYVDRHPSNLLSHSDLAILISKLKTLPKDASPVVVFDIVSTALTRSICGTHSISLTWAIHSYRSKL